ncbi:MAG: M48 family metalloprotease [Deltaproteobacteria bacterium]|nr:M48 family metalloprotease [Deltaproteobacteria bacterium]
MFNNIIYFIVVLLIFTVSYSDISPDESLLYSITGLVICWGAFAAYCRWSFFYFNRRIASGRYPDGALAERYERLNLRLSILAILLFATAIYFFSLKQWLLAVPGIAAFSVVQGLFAIALFLFYLSTIWYLAWPTYRTLFNVNVGRRSFVLSHLRFNLPVLFPWFVLTFVYDLLSLSPWASSSAFLNSLYGQLVFFAVFLSLLVVVMPKFIQYWWGCKPLEASEKGRHLAAFLKQQGFRYRHLLSWPIFEGRMMTAGIMGIVPRYRYILVTDALMSALSMEELESVLAHEMGHARYFHLLFYVLFFVGFMVISFGLSDVYIYIAYVWSPLAELISEGDARSMTLFYLSVSVPMLLTLLIYFRYIMGFFMRHFERQADLYAATVMGTPEFIINALEKIAYLSGKSRDVPNWHHFSIGQRVACLLKTLEIPRLARKQNRFVLISFLVYLAGIGCLGYYLNFGDMKTHMAYDLVSRELSRKLEEYPRNIGLAMNLAMVYQRMGKEAATMDLYEQIIQWHPSQAVALNNLAWMMLTASDPDFRNGARALALARKAVVLQPTPQFLDTLAETCYQNGLKDEAIQIIQEAIEKADENRDYYESQLRKYRFRGGD